MKFEFHRISKDSTALLVETVGEDCSTDCKHSLQIFELQPKPVFRGSILIGYNNKVECKLQKKDTTSRPCFGWTGVVKYDAPTETSKFFRLEIDRKGTQLKFSDEQEIAGVEKATPAKYEFSKDKYQCVDGCL